jgi:uncharacterized membrane protein YgcG
MNIMLILSAFLALLQIGARELAPQLKAQNPLLFMQGLEFFFTAIGFYIAENKDRARAVLRVLTYNWVHLLLFSVLFLIYTRLTFPSSLGSMTQEIPSYALLLHNYFFESFDVKWFGFLWPVFTTLQFLLLVYLTARLTGQGRLRLFSVGLIFSGLFWEFYFKDMFAEWGLPSWAYAALPPTCSILELVWLSQLFVIVNLDPESFSLCSCFPSSLFFQIVYYQF